MSEFADALRFLQPFVFAAVAIATAARWWRARDASSGWAAMLFAVLAGAVIASRALPDDPTGWAQRLAVSMLLLFPLILWRFAATFRRPPPRADALVWAATLALVAIVWLVPAARDDERSVASVIFVLAAVATWAVISAVVALQLWRSAAGRPTVVRRRMRTLSAGVLLLALALLITGTSPDFAVVELAVALLALASAPLFLLGLAPPDALTARWRRSEEAQLRAAEVRLVEAVDPDEVADALLPHLVRSLGATAATLIDRNGDIRSSFPPAAEQRPHSTRVTVPMETGALVLHVDRYTPYFGRAETGAMARLAELTDVALRRAESTARERAAASEMERAHQAMQEFVAVASHDLRTPIALIRGYAATLSGTWSTTEDATRRQYLEVIERQSDYLSRLVDDLLMASLIDVGGLEPDAERVDLTELVSGIIRDLGRPGDVRCCADAPVRVLADPDHCERIIRNLVDNALAHGTTPVDVVVGRNSDGAQVTIRDHGLGVPEPLVDRMFEAFARSEGPSRRRRGTGLGLSIVRGLARANGGDVWYERAEPGARFVVRLPAVPDITDAQDTGATP